MTRSSSNEVEKIPWHGVLISVQPRIRLSRSFDQRSHTYLGYSLTVRGSVGTEAREFRLGVGQGAHAKHHFRVGDTVSCPLYESGPARKVPCRHGMTYTEEDWVDVEATSHRRLDE